MRRLLPLALLAAAGCIDDLEPPQYLVTDLRLLGVGAEIAQADPAAAPWADAVPGDVLRLTALVANPLGRGPLSVAFHACPPELLPSCPREADLRDASTLAAAGLLPLGAAACTAEGAGATCTLSYPVPPASDPRLAELLRLLTRHAAEEEPTFQCRLYAEVPVVVVAEAEGLREVAVKRVRLTPDPAAVTEPALAGDYVRNANPAIGALFGAATEEACPHAAAPLSATSFPPARTFLCGTVASAPQSYFLCDGAGVRTPAEGFPESLSWQWYATAGEFPEVDGVGNATGVAPEFVRPAGAFTLWAILRDGRGGVGWRPLAVDAVP